jgi:hypothetical protein
VSDWLGGLAYWHYLLFFCLCAEVEYFREHVAYVYVFSVALFHIVYFINLCVGL